MNFTLREFYLNKKEPMAYVGGSGGKNFFKKMYETLFVSSPGVMQNWGPAIRRFWELTADGHVQPGLESTAELDFVQQDG